MGYQALLFCADERTIPAVTQVLNELDFSVESCSEPFAAVKRITAQHFDALIVDCENEQNATLLFKTARNSAVNNASLSVAMVQGQAGIAKAFRLGANLVLTKPINVEQSKGTLRVARGLLRKAEAGKVTAAAAEAQRAPENVEELQSAALPALVETQAPVVPVTESPIASIPVASAALEVEQESGPQPDAAEAALLESMPLPVLPNAAISVDGPPISIAKASSPESESKAERAAGGEQSAGKSSKRADKATAIPGRTEVSQISLAAAEVKESRRSDRKSASGQGSAATAAAPAKELPQPVTDLFAAKSASAKPADVKSAEAPKGTAKQSPPAGKKIAAQSGGKKAPANFAWLEGSRDPDNPGRPGSKRNFFIAAVLVLGLAAAGYFSWPRLEPILMSFPLVQKYLGQVISLAPAMPAGTATSSTAGTASAANAATVPQAGQSTGTSAAGPSSPQSGTTSESASAGNQGASQSTAGSVAAINSSASPAQPLRLSQAVSEGLLLTSTQPLYPAHARQARLAGNVQLQANIAKDGSVTQLKALSGDPMLVRAALDAVRQWKYKPYSLNGQPVEFETEITVNFKLPD